MEVVNNPQTQAPQSNGGNGFGFLLGVILLIIFIFALIYYGLPLIRSAVVPAPSTNVNIPDEVDINIDGQNQSEE